MKIVVPVKQVAALDDEFELLDDGSGVDPDFLEFDLNEWDAFSLEVALELREAAGDGEVVVVTVGDEESEEALLSCLAKGAEVAQISQVTTGEADGLEGLLGQCAHDGRRPLGQTFLAALDRQPIAEIVSEDDIHGREQFVLDEAFNSAQMARHCQAVVDIPI